MTDNPTLCPLTWPQQRRNLVLFALGIGMNYLAAPVLYVGITQSSLVDKLGGSTKTANLPATIFFAMTAIPALYAWMWPGVAALKRNLTICYSLCALMLGAVAVALRMDVSNSFKIGMVILQGGVSGAVMPAATAYLWEAVSRGSDESRRGLALGMAFGMGPILAVIGSLGQAALLGGRFFGWEFPKGEGLDGYMLLFAAGVPMMGLAVLFGLMLIIPQPERDAEREPVSQVVGLLFALPAMLASVFLNFRADVVDEMIVKGESMSSGGNLDALLQNPGLLRGLSYAFAAVSAAGFIYHFRSIFRQRTLLVATLVTILVYCGNMMPSNMNLYSAEALKSSATSVDADSQQDVDLPTKYAAMQNTLKFSFKVFAGLLLGWLLTRTNPRAGIVATSAVFLVAALWAMIATGPWYLLAFGIYGAGELIGVYAPNYIVSASKPGELRKNTAFMTLLMMPAAPAGVLYGTLVNMSKERGWTWNGMNPATFGFRLSFLVAAGLILSGILLALAMLPKTPRAPVKE